MMTHEGLEDLLVESVEEFVFDVDSLSSSGGPHKQRCPPVLYHDIQQVGIAECVCQMWVYVYIPYIKVMPGYFVSFETFVLFAQAPDEGN